MYYIGKAFYDLAGKHGKHQWGFAIGGVASYYIGTFFGGILIAIGALILGYDVENIANYILNLMAFPIGILVCYLFYQLLKRRWENVPVLTGNGTLDEDLM